MVWRQSSSSGNGRGTESPCARQGGRTLVGQTLKAIGRAKLVASLVILAAAVLSLVLNWPGHLSYDSVLQLAEGRGGSYSGAHPPVMSWLLGLGDAVTPGPILFILLQTTLIAGALLLFLGLGARVGRRAVIVCLVVCATPQLLIYPSIVWKDVLFAGASVFGFACLAWSAACWDRRLPRFAWLTAAGVMLVLATLTRQNGATVLPFGALAVAGVAASASRTGRVSRGLSHGVAFLAATTAVAAAGALALNTRTDPAAAANSPWRALQAYDLVNTLTFAPDTELPVLHRRAPWLEKVLRSQGVAAYSPIRADGLEPILDKAEAQGAVEAPLAAQWRAFIVTRPWLYLRARLRTFGWVFLTPDHDQCVLIYTGIDGDPDDMAAAGVARRDTDRDDTLADAALLLAPTPVYSHATYAVLSLLLMAFLLRRRRPSDLAVAAMLGGALAFASSFFIISIACDYRYLYALDIAAMAAAVYAAATWRGGTAVPKV
jgi:hypothetical protein